MRRKVLERKDRGTKKNWTKNETKQSDNRYDEKKRKMRAEKRDKRDWMESDGNKEWKKWPEKELEEGKMRYNKADIGMEGRRRHGEAWKILKGGNRSWKSEKRK